MKKILVMIFTAAISMAVTGPSVLEASVPKLLTYQGILKDASGSYLTGSYGMTFRIYGASSGGSTLWSESQTGVSVSSGRFSVELGSVGALNLDFSQDYWLSVQVGTDSEMTPRQRLTSAGYALMAESVVNGFSQAQHDALSHRDIEGVKANASNIAKTNFKLDAYTLASANSLGDMIVDTFNDATGINAAASSGYSWRGSPNYDVTVSSSGGNVIEQSTSENDMFEMLSNQSAYYNGVGEKFQHNLQVTVDKVAFKWARWGSPTGNVRVRIYSDSAGLPGTLLGESANINVANIALGYPSYEEYTATLTSAVTLSANTAYHAVIENINASGDGSNYVKVRRAGSGNPYEKGYPVAKNSSGSWANTPGDAYDTYFKVYEQPAAGSASVQSVAFSVSQAPSSVMVIPDETLGSGLITYWMSRNNGATWTACAKNTLVSIASQPSGTQVKWKAAISGDAELNSIAVSM